MLSLNGNSIYCRTTEEKILDLWDKNKYRKVSCRDFLYPARGEKVYRLWNTDLVVENLETHKVMINLSGASEMDYMYYRYGRNKDVIMTQTTKSRLNAFLQYYGLDTLEVHNSMKDFSVKYRGKVLKIDSWYSLDLENKELIPVEE